MSPATSHEPHDGEDPIKREEGLSAGLELQSTGGGPPSQASGEKTNAPTSVITQISPAMMMGENTRDRGRDGRQHSRECGRTSRTALWAARRAAPAGRMVDPRTCRAGARQIG